MSNQPPGRHRTSSPAALQQVLGTVIFLAVTVAWFLAKREGIDTGELLAFAVPVVGALFLVGQVGKAADAATAAANQTNGMLEPRIKAAVAAALADRDAARTRQAVGDISEAGSPPTELPASDAKLPSSAPSSY